ncbi:MAG: glycosyltransferase family 2 protein [Candidatus Shapirobacteria bacterium]|nr:glycosyltransferase family 2 protein [Candidatus Shapirobacteria bacterium]MDD5074153.1 glycosyltransferase family 2 protein [Candidatus Shapirobacteria bacterium]MDD5481756.1 glycosyltransferase family 2 protein [Candidatus Shapirobacteria bacterium]
MVNISIIIPNWNGEKQLAKNLPILAKLLPASKISTEVLVVDDASTDSSLAVLEEIKTKSLFKNFVVFKKDVNRGFADSVNQGAALAKGKFIFLLNTDVVVEAGCFEALLPHFDRPDVFAVGANADWHLGIVSFEKGFLDISFPKKISSRETRAQKSFWVSGGHALFRKSLWQELGGIDTLFAPFYFEETDLCYRAWKRGYRVLWEPKARVDHRHEESVIRQNFPSDYIDFIAQRNQLFFIWKNIHDSKMLKEHCFNLMKRLINHPKYTKVFLSAASKLPKVLTRRQVEKKEAVLSDGEVLEMVTGNK